MDDTQALAKVPESRTVELVADQRLVIESGDGGNVLRIVGSTGRTSLSIHVTKDGPVLRFGGDALTIQAEGDLAIDAGRVAIRGREGLALSTDGDVEIVAAGDLRSTARIQTITADLGNVNIKANDDVKCNGERVLLNC